MNLQEILSRTDHTLLNPTAKGKQLAALVEEAARHHTASVCVPPCWVKDAVELGKGQVPVTTVVGFPLGYSTTASKCFEAKEAVENGASEIDMVINQLWARDDRYEDILGEIQAVKAACGEKVLKVIVETCNLTEIQKITLADVVGRSGAEYIKTSTGFGDGGATPEDVALLRKYSPQTVKVKAAGGIASLEDAEKLLSAGADRLGSSRLTKLAEAQA